MIVLNKQIILIAVMLELATPTVLRANPLLNRSIGALIVGIASGTGEAIGENLARESRPQQSSARVCSTAYGVCPIWVEQPIPRGIACYCFSIYGDYLDGVTH